MSHLSIYLSALSWSIHTSLSLQNSTQHILSPFMEVALDNLPL